MTTSRTAQPAPLTPESNTEAAQQHAAELEQGDEPSFADDLRELMGNWDKSRAAWIAHFGNDAGFGDWFSAQLGLPTSRQPDFFAARVDDLPLFSGTAPRGQAQTFDPPAADGHRQAKLF